MKRKSKTRKKLVPDRQGKSIRASGMLIPGILKQTALIRVVGDSRLVVHRFSEKARKEILDKQMKKARQAKEAKDPNAEYEASLYRAIAGDGYVFPATAFKSAAVDASVYVAGLEKKKKFLNGAFHVVGDWVVIEGTPVMREDIVRIGGITKVPDIRYRGEFTTWSATIPVLYNANAVSLEQLMNLFNIAGFGVGVGEYRPEKGGNWGMFHVATVDEQKKAA